MFIYAFFFWISYLATYTHAWSLTRVHTYICVFTRNINLCAPNCQDKFAFSEHRFGTSSINLILFLRMVSSASSECRGLSTWFTYQRLYFPSVVVWLVVLHRLPHTNDSMHKPDISSNIANYNCRCCCQRLQWIVGLGQIWINPFIAQFTHVHVAFIGVIHNELLPTL